MPVYEDPKAKKNKYYFELDVPTENGKRKRIKRRGFSRKTDAKNAMIALQNEILNGTYLEPSKITLTDYMKDWLKNKQDLSYQTRDLYASYLKIHINPRLGHIPLSKLTAQHIQTFIYTLREEKKLAPGTIRRIFNVINTSLRSAVKLGLITRNVADLIEKPKDQRQKEFMIWTNQEAKAFIDQIIGTTRYDILFITALYTGMRQGEILGLRWKDIDYHQKIIRVVQTLTHDGKHLKQGAKTLSSIRTIAVSEALITFFIIQEGRVEQERNDAGDGYVDNNLVFPTSIGTPVRPRDVVKTWKKKLRNFNLPKMTFHDIRHTHASMLLASGVNVKVISERLGHSSPRMTLEVYSHLLPHMQQEAADKIADIFT